MGPETKNQVAGSPLFNWLTKPLFRMQQKKYAKALIFRRRKEHNARYQAMVATWEDNEVTGRCREFVRRLSEVDFTADPEHALELFELTLANLNLPSSKNLLKKFDHEVEKMIEFEENLPLRIFLELYPNEKGYVEPILARDKQTVELKLERQAKKVIRELVEHVNDMATVYKELVAKLPVLRRACKPGVIARTLSFLGDVAPKAGNIASVRASSTVSSVACEVGGDMLQRLLHSFRDHLHNSSISEAVHDFGALVTWFDEACEDFAASTRSRFDPIFQSYMGIAKGFEDEFIDTIQEIARTELSLKPIYEKLYGKLGY